MNQLLKCALKSYAKHLEVANQKPLAAILDGLMVDERNNKPRVAERLGITLYILEDLFGLCETRPLEEINHD